jgi:AAA+ ATPase superfamily predicted ATPase
MKYLTTLTGLGFVDRRIPVFSNQAKTRKGIYRISDPLFAFWYRYLFPVHDEIELGTGEILAQKKVLPFLPELIGHRFEDICLQWVRRENKKGALPFIATTIGTWWGTDSNTREQTDVDLIAADSLEGKLLLGECKWQESLEAGSALKTLQNKADLFPDFKETWFYLFSKKEFDAASHRIAKGNNRIALVSLDTLF